MTERRWGYVIGVLLATFCAIAQFRLINISFQPSAYLESVQAAQGVLEGRPHWKTFQGRVLGPIIVKGLSVLTGDFVAAHVIFSIAALTLAGFLAWHLGHRHGDNALAISPTPTIEETQGDVRSALMALAVFEACFAFLVSPPWLYTWDFIDLIVFLIFVDLVLSKARLRWFLLLFAVALWNRDSANFIALYLIVDALSRFVVARARSPLDWRWITAGGGCIVASIVISTALVYILLIEETAPKFNPMLPADTRLV
jgi:hypothetical protein